MRRGLRPTLVLVAAGLLVALAACAGPATSPVASIEPFATSLQDASDADASRAQIDALRESSHTGEMSFETISTLVDATLECFADAGLSFRREEPIEVAPGFLLPFYGVGDTTTGDGSASALATACEHQHSYFAFVAYQNQSGVQTALDAALLEELPEVRACLADNGFDLPADATPDEVRQAVWQVAAETDDAGSVVLCSENL